MIWEAVNDSPRTAKAMRFVHRDKCDPEGETCSMPLDLAMDPSGLGRLLAIAEQPGSDVASVIRAIRILYLDVQEETAPHGIWSPISELPAARAR